MRKITLSVLVMSVLVLATPVYAAGPFDFSVSELLNFLGIKLPAQSAQYDIKPTPTLFPAGTSRQSFGDVLKDIRGTTGGGSAVKPTGKDKGGPEVTGKVNKPLLPTTGKPVKATGAPDEAADKESGLKDVVTRMVNGYANRLDNYSDFLTKVKSRRDKLAADGKDVTKIDAFISTATVNFAQAQAALAGARSALLALDYTQNTGTVIQAIRKELTKVREAFTVLHKSMSETVAEIVTKSGSVGTDTPRPTKVDRPDTLPTQANKPNDNGNGNNTDKGGKK